MAADLWNGMIQYFTNVLWIRNSWDHYWYDEKFVKNWVAALRADFFYQD